MSDTPERSGLARSIDQLFTTGRSARDDEPPTGGNGAVEAEGSAMLHPAVPLVAALGRERDDDRRHAIVDELARLGEPAADSIADALAQTEDRFARSVYLDALISLAPVSLKVVEEMMDDPRWFVVRNGSFVLGEIGSPRAVELLVGGLARPEPKVRREAVLALAKAGGVDASQLVFGMLDDPATTVRVAAVSAVGALGVERAVKPLMRMLDQEDDPDLLLAALHALGHLGDPAAVRAIEHHAVGSFLRRPPRDLRIAAYGALRHIGTPHARRLLNQAVDDRDPAVKAEVRRLLGMA
ncbi:MAG: HEAT repeat domain-containing protein [Gemmatimonadota bacterium]